MQRVGYSRKEEFAARKGGSILRSETPPVAKMTQQTRPRQGENHRKEKIFR